MMKRYRLINNLTGWGVFIFSAIIFLLTIEPTASLWDCGEFIATSMKLEVGHPPGNSVFMLMANFFANFALGNVHRVAPMVNSMSALASAFAVLFLFWTITHLARKILIKSEDQMTTSRIIAVMAAGMVGAIAYSFTDSFWFSAVEGEVYASSSFFTALVVWAMLKWEDAADEKYGDKWIILIAFLTGLSIGVHLLNLLTIPALALVYYFRKYEFSWKSFLISTVISMILLGLVLFGLIPGVFVLADKIDMFFVNSLNMPVNSGMIFQVILLIVFFILAVRATLNSSGRNRIAFLSIAAFFLSGIWIVTGSFLLNLIVLAALGIFVWYIADKNRYLLNIALTSVMVLLIGYSSNSIIFIRASVNPPLDENNPSNPNNFLYFINREQYGERPLFKGQYFNAPVLEYKDGKARYSVVDGKYKVTSHDIERVYDERFITLFPRMWSDQSEHVQPYQEWSRMKGVPIQVTDQNGKAKIIRKPTFLENLRFMLSYQIDYMYFRYFMWNFSGRQNDTQGYGGAVNGNWITGIDFLDQKRVGTSDMPADIKNDPSRNTYYMLPFILGLIGLFYHFNRDVRNWWIVMLLFLMTGLAIILYLNQYPLQPRERDYAYAGSFYFFAIWIGIGVLALFELLARFMKEKLAAPAAGIVCALAVPVIMGTHSYAQHDRSGRYLARDVACNYLNSCAPDAILFTNGDNDTFPLWYAQEVEGIRTDVRICNLMLLNTDWYIDEMKYRTNESAPLPVSLPSKKYYDGVNNQVFIVEKTKDPVDIKTIIEWVNSDNPATKVQVSANETLDIIPSRTIRIPVDAAKVVEAGVVKPEDADKIVPFIDIRLKGSSIMKSSLIVLDILAHNDWKRPIYFVTGYHSDAMGLEEYFQLEGIAYRLVPIKTQNKSWLEYGRVDTEILYNNLMKKFLWRGAKEKGVNIDYNHKRTLIVVKARYNYARLAKALIAEGKNEKAIEVLDYCMATFPLDKIPYDMYMTEIVEAYLQAGATEKGVSMSKELADYYFKRLDYYMKQEPDILSSADYEIQTAIQYVSKTASSLKDARQDQLSAEYAAKVENYYTQYVRLMKAEGKTGN
jgi:phage shock protein PspC (stress-responsive transcriptional regulator)